MSAATGGCKPVRAFDLSAVEDWEVVVGEGAGSEAEGGEGGSRIPVRIKDPKLPSCEEENGNMLTRLPRRS